MGGIHDYSKIEDFILEKSNLNREEINMKTPDFTWVNTHKELVEYLKDKKNNQIELINLLKSVGVKSVSDKKNVDLEEIDPFTFFRYIYKHRNEDNRLRYLERIAKKLQFDIPTGVSGIPTVSALKTNLFPQKADRNNDEINRLWRLFENTISNTISDEQYQDILEIANIAKTTLTEGIFNVNPENYLPINKPVKKYFNDKYKMDLNFNSFTEYQNLLEKIKSITGNKKFREISYEAYMWGQMKNSGTEKKYIKKDIKNINKVNYPLNTIFYGPPGTGKTYHSIIRAAKIIKGEDIDNNEALKVFNNNLGDKIEFIAFHQNYSYEEFIQGLRPDLEDDNNLKFKRVDGIFKKLCKRASNIQITPGMKFKDYTVIKANNDIIELERNQNKKIRYVPVRIIEDLMKALEEDKIELRDIRERKLKDKHLADIISSKVEKYYFGVESTLFEICKHLSKRNEIKNNDRYVLIIDEINRANISRVFGEIISLIEEDKRESGKRSLKVKLPSGEEFSVPSNIYIIGTMNTADKSIALLDVALRRRFEFEPFYPKYKLDDDKIFYSDVLKKINEAIIEEKGHDFQIGHSYFMEENLSKIINKKVIPLLQEYFVNDHHKILDVLEKAGIRINKDSFPYEMKENEEN